MKIERVAFNLAASLARGDGSVQQLRLSNVIASKKSSGRTNGRPDLILLKILRRKFESREP